MLNGYKLYKDTVAGKEPMDKTEISNQGHSANNSYPQHWLNTKTTTFQVPLNFRTYEDTFTEKV